MRFIYCWIAFGFFISVPGVAQRQLSTKSKKAAEYYYEADKYRVRGQYQTALDLLEQAVRKDKNFHEAYFRIAVILKAKGELKEAENAFQRVLQLKDGNNAPSYFELSELYLQKNKYAKALEFADKFLQSGSRNSKRIQEAEQFKKNAQFGLENADIASQYNPRPLSDTVNAFPMQYFPIVSVDQNALIFTRRLGTTNQYDEDLVVSNKLPNGAWGPPESISNTINSEFNEGTCTISGDGRTLIFTSCYGRKGYGSCDLYISVKVGDDWSVPANLGSNINTSAWESQPSLSSDGRTLYYVSNRKDGIGKRDIWMSTINENGDWQKPENLGRTINTVHDEVSPFIHPNNKVLYFASNGLTGFGGFDIYFSDRKESAWATPKNIGFPINTGEDQVSLYISSDGSKGYYSHEDNKDIGRKGRLYEFEVPESAKLKYKSSYVHGVVTDADTGVPLRARIELFDLKKNNRVGLVSSDSIQGDYLMVLTEGSEYALYIDKKGYLFHSLSFDYSELNNFKPVMQDVALRPIKTGASTVLKNIFFDTDSYALRPESQTELDKVIKFLNLNPEVSIEISGHTDNVGTYEYNLKLSKNRAKAVFEYLFKAGIEKSKLKYSGYGPNRPIDDNSTLRGRQNNRRIEFNIL
ncbi:MAG: OmpA family protein [Bacteroidota bacterium]